MTLTVLSRHKMSPNN